MVRVRGGLIVHFLADENIPAAAVRLLREHGYEVETVVGLGLLGEPDIHIVEAGAELGATILTLDLDFGRIFVEREPELQILVLRPRQAVPDQVCRVLQRVLGEADLDARDLEHALIVAGEAGYRVRHHQG